MSEEQGGPRVSECPGPAVSIRVRGGVGLQMRVPPVSPRLVPGLPEPPPAPHPPFLVRQDTLSREGSPLRRPVRKERVLSLCLRRLTLCEEQQFDTPEGQAMKNSKELRQTAGAQTTSLPASANLTALAGAGGGFAKVPALWREARRSHSTWVVSTLSPGSPGRGSLHPAGGRGEQGRACKAAFTHARSYPRARGSVGPRAELSAPNSEPPRQARGTPRGTLEPHLCLLQALGRGGHFPPDRPTGPEGEGHPNPTCAVFFRKPCSPRAVGEVQVAQGHPAPAPGAWGHDSVPCCPLMASGKAHSPCVDVTAGGHA